MLISTFLAVAAMGGQANINQHGTIAVTEGVMVMRGGAPVQGGGAAITLADGDMVKVSSDAKAVTIICPDNSLITMRPGSSLRMGSWGQREEYIFKGGSFHVYSCPHDAPAGARRVSMRTCCIRMWYPEQMHDTNFDVTVVGGEKCVITHQSGVFFKQRNVGDRAVGPVIRVDG